MKAGRLSLAAFVTLATLTMASAARAEKYVEIWNPPEARGHSSVQKPVRPHAQSPKAPRLARKVTEPDSAPVQLGASAAASTSNGAKRPSSPGPANPANRGIPRKIGPDGNVFTV
jgi:hypothetical protein